VNAFATFRGVQPSVSAPTPPSEPEPGLELIAPAAALDAPRLAYGFAKQRGLVVLGLDGDAARIGLRDGADPTALIEARRVIGRPLRVEPLGRAAFDKVLSEAYAGERLSSGDDFDLPAVLKVWWRTSPPPPTCWTRPTTRRSSA
jgi:hypothetical protein